MNSEEPKINSKWRSGDFGDPFPPKEYSIIKEVKEGWVLFDIINPYTINENCRCSLKEFLKYFREVK